MGKLNYMVLKGLSHPRNLMTNDEIAQQFENQQYDIDKSEKFVRCLNRYVTYEGKRVLEIGSGSGDLAIYLAQTGAKSVVGVDLDSERIEAANRKARTESVTEVVDFVCADFVDEYEPPYLFDMVISDDAFEHIPAPIDCLRKAKMCLSTNSVLVTMFGPLWRSPYGAHMWDFTRVPWVHFLFPEKTVLKVRKEYFRPDDDVDRYEDVRGHLNRMTVGRFKDNVATAGFSLETLRLNPPQDYGRYKYINSAINRLPILQELGALSLFAILRKNE